jgi:predicted kinase
MQPTLYLMVGYPGAGKTTTAQFIHELTGAEHVWADYERQQMFGHQGQSSQESKQLYRELNKRVEELLRQGKSVIFDTNFRFRRDRDEMRKLADRAGAAIQIIWMATDKSAAQKRATELSDNAPNRFFGNISLEDFKRVTDFMQEPTDDEKPIRFDGLTLTQDEVAKALGL